MCTVYTYVYTVYTYVYSIYSIYYIVHNIYDIVLLYTASLHVATHCHAQDILLPSPSAAKDVLHQNICG